MKIISCLNLKLWLLIISVNLFSCENDKHVTEPGLEEGFFKLFFNLNDLNSNYYVSSIALIDTNNLILSTYGCIDTCSIYVIKNEKLISIDSSDFEYQPKGHGDITFRKVGPTILRAFSAFFERSAQL